MELSTGTILLLVYLHGVTGAIQVVAFILVFALGISAFAAFVVFSVEEAWDEKTKKLTKNLAIGFVVASMVATLAPSKSTFENMLIAYGLSEIIQTDSAKKTAAATTETAGKVIEVLNKKLDEELAK